MSDRIARWTDLDRRLVQIARKVRVLGSLSWPSHVIDAFLAGHRKGSVALPDPPEERRDCSRAIADLEALRQGIDQSDPFGRYLDDTAGSYSLAARMLEVQGTPAFLDISRLLYGIPGDRLPGSDKTHLDAADQLLAATASLGFAGLDAAPDVVFGADVARDDMQRSIDAFFGAGVLDVDIDPELGSKAAAGSKRVRVRAQTGFSRMEIDQLLEHEAFVHAATALNGRGQPVLSSMGLAAPRTTLTQEGLATVAELVTHTIDIARLRRIALRIRAIAMALDGADFVQVFQYFLEQGQSEDESVRSAMRIFRGGDLHGRWVFTKDVVYVQGLVVVHTFLRKAIEARKPVLIERLFAGRVHLSDLLLLEHEFDAGHVVSPRYVPRWAQNLPALAAYLAFAQLAYRIEVTNLELDAILPAVDL